MSGNCGIQVSRFLGCFPSTSSGSDQTEFKEAFRSKVFGKSVNLIWKRVLIKDGSEHGVLADVPLFLDVPRKESRVKLDPQLPKSPK